VIMAEPATGSGLRKLAAEAIRYYAVAGLVALGYLAVYGGLLALGVHYYLAIAIAQVITIAWAFPLYRRVVFRWEGPWYRAFPRFVGVWGGGMIAGFVATPLLVELAHVPPFWAQLITMVVVSVASYLLHRVVTFRRRPTQTEERP
jgi:putative flippase GtrA